jgi:hypothetical protein
LGGYFFFLLALNSGFFSWTIIRKLGINIDIAVN